jgi:hypothetical protein
MAKPERKITMSKFYICGTKAECDLVPPGNMVAVSCGSPSILRAKLQAMNPSVLTVENITEVVSFGTCRALSTLWCTGELVTMRRNITSYDYLIDLSAGEKALCASRTRALAADMETDIAESFAKVHGLSFRIMRAVAEPMIFTLPSAALLPLKLDGTPDHLAIAISVLRNPFQIPALIKLNSYTKIALRTLESALEQIS